MFGFLTLRLSSFVPLSQVRVCRHNYRMTDLDQHPDAPTEAQHLNQALEKLEQRIDEVGTWDVKGFEGHEAAALQTQLVRTYDNLVTARKQVYFGRMEVLPAGKQE